MNPEYKVNLKINDRKIPIKPYVEEVFYKVIYALVDTLKKPDEEINLIDIKIQTS